MIFIKNSFLVLILSTLIVAKLALSEDQRVVHLVTGSESYPPLTGQSLPSGGLFTEIVTIIFQRMGYQPVVDYEEWAVGKDDLTLRRGAYIATFPYAKNKDREKLFVYSKPVYSASRFLYKRAGDLLTFSELKSSSSPTEKIVCRPEGYHLNDIKPLIEKNIINIQQPKSLDECFERLVNGQVDFVVAINFVGDHYISENKIQSTVIKDDMPIGEDDFYVIFPRTNRLVSSYVNDFNTELTKMEKSGEIYNIIEAQLLLYYKSFKH